MNRNVLLSLPMACVAALAFAQAPGIALPPGASPQAAQDPGYQALIATCKTPPPARGGGPGEARLREVDAPRPLRRRPSLPHRPTTR